MSDLFVNFGLYESAENYLKTGGNVFLYTFEHIRLGISGLMEDFLPFLGTVFPLEYIIPIFFSC